MFLLGRKRFPFGASVSFRHQSKKRTGFQRSILYIWLYLYGNHEIAEVRLLEHSIENSKLL